jgi:hypothetical protein
MTGPRRDRRGGNLTMPGSPVPDAGDPSSREGDP